MWNRRVKVITNASLGKNVHGVFADNALAGFGDKGYEDWYLKDSPERGKALLEGQQALFEQARKAGKYLIFNGLRPVQDYAALDTLLPHADSGYFEPWLGGAFRSAAGKLNASKATEALLKMINHSTARPSRIISPLVHSFTRPGIIEWRGVVATMPFVVSRGRTKSPTTRAGTNLAVRLESRRLCRTRASPSAVAPRGMCRQAAAPWCRSTRPIPRCCVRTPRTRSASRSPRFSLGSRIWGQNRFSAPGKQ